MHGIAGIPDEIAHPPLRIPHRDDSEIGAVPYGLPSPEGIARRVRRPYTGITFTAPSTLKPGPRKEHPLMKSDRSVTCEIVLRLLVAGNGAVAVPTTLVYNPADPYAVHATMHAASGSVEWIFSRDLLHRGLRRPCGVGDVHVAPATGAHRRAVVSIELSTPDGEAVLHADTSDLAAFLTSTFLAVPRGCESAHLDIDAALAFLVAGN